MGLDVVSLFVNDGLLVAKGRDYDPTILALSINVPVAPLSNNVFTDNNPSWMIMMKLHIISQI